MRKVSGKISLIIAILLLYSGLVMTVFAEPQPIQLSDEERMKFSTYFSNFTEAGLDTFVSGQLNDDELIQFGIYHIINNLAGYDIKHVNGNWRIASDDIDYVTNKYFSRVVASHHSVGRHSFIDGYYQFPRGYGEGWEFAVVQSLHDNGDGTYTAIVDQYSAGDIPRDRIEGVYKNSDGSYTVKMIGEDHQGRPIRREIPGMHLVYEWRALIQPVYEGENKRYILLEYRKIFTFAYVQDNWVYYLAKEEGIIED